MTRSELVSEWVSGWACEWKWKVKSEMENIENSLTPPPAAWLLRERERETKNIESSSLVREWVNVWEKQFIRRELRVIVIERMCENKEEKRITKCDNKEEKKE